MDERRMILAVFLMIVVVYVYSAFFMKPAPPRPRPAAPAPTAAAQAPSPAPQAEAPASAVPVAPAAPTPAARVSEPVERLITVETNVVHAQFSNRGGELVSWRLKKFLDDRKQPQELVPQNLPGTPVRPFTLLTGDNDVNARLDAALFKASTEASTIDATKAPVHLAFEFQDDSGLRVRKDFDLQPDSYIVQFNAEVAQGDRAFNPFVAWGPGLGDAASAETSRYLQKPQAIFYSDSMKRMAASQLTPDKCYGAPTQNGCAWEGNFHVAGVDDQYFVSAVLPRGNVRVEYQPVALQVEVPPSRSIWQTISGAPAPTTPTIAIVELVSYAAKVSRTTPGMRVFFGPKEFAVLRAVDPGMVGLINFGFFSFLAVPLLQALKSVNAYVGNYGWAIIILTIIINAVMFPLRHKSMVSMRKMQAIQPQIKAIQDRYAKMKMSDPARSKMNTEMMALYKEKGVSPASGCVPMLLTMPLLFAFYSMLGQAIEVRGASFFYLQDLSRYDPYYVLPVLMGVTMVWQQKMTPASVDPAQQKMMMFMPIMFVALFVFAPSGLALYFLLSNLLAIGQQYLTNRLTAPAPVRKKA